VNLSELCSLPLSTNPHICGLQTQEKVCCDRMNQSLKASGVSWGANCCLNCSLVGLLILLKYTNGCFIHFHHLSAYNLYIAIPILPINYICMTFWKPLYCKFESSKNCEGSLELRGMIFPYFPFVWVIVKIASFPFTLFIKCFLSFLLDLLVVYLY
jgi:hypothetical protein